MKSYPGICLLTMALVAASLSAAPESKPAAPTKPPTIAATEDADTAWRNVTEWRSKITKGVQQGKQFTSKAQLEKWRESPDNPGSPAFSTEQANRSRDFYTRFPDDKRALSARLNEIEALDRILQRGRDKAVEQRLANALVEALRVSADKPDYRVQFRSYQLGLKYLQAGTTRTDAQLAIARQLISEFPSVGTGYYMLMHAVERMSDQAEGRRLIEEYIAAPTTPDEMKKMLEGKLQLAAKKGHPVELKFTAMDGRAVDLAQLHGHPVLLVFWATNCPPCVAEIPVLKAAHAKWHKKGLEIVGVNLDADRAKAEALIAKEQMPWPQYWTEGGFKHATAVSFGVTAIPCVFLIDREGRFTGRDLHREGNLTRSIDRIMQP